MQIISIVLFSGVFALHCLFRSGFCYTFGEINSILKCVARAHLSMLTTCSTKSLHFSCCSQMTYSNKMFSRFIVRRQYTHFLAYTHLHSHTFLMQVQSRLETAYGVTRSLFTMFVKIPFFSRNTFSRRTPDFFFLQTYKSNVCYFDSEEVALTLLTVMKTYLLATSRN